MARDKNKKKLMTAKQKRLKEMDRKRRQRAKYTAEQKLQKKLTDREYNQNKRKTFCELTAAEQKAQNEKSKLRMRKYRQRQKDAKNLEVFLRENSPAASNCDNDEVQQPEPRQLAMGRKRVQARKSKAYKEIAKLKKENERLKTKVKYKKRSERERDRVKKLTIKSTPDKIVDEIPAVKNLPQTVKRKLVYNELIVRHLGAKSKDIKSHKDKEKFTDIVTPPKVKQYAMIREHTRTFSKNVYYKKIVHKSIRKCRSSQRTAKLIEDFYEEDINSRMCPGKKDVVVKHKITKQKRVLLDTMKNLYANIVAKHGKIVSVQTFRRFRPFWVVFLKERDRDVCACTLCSNTKLMLKALHAKKIMKTDQAYDLLKEQNVEAEILDDCTISFFQWESKYVLKNVKGKVTKCRIVEKMLKEETTKEGVERFFQLWARYVSHKMQIQHQYHQLKFLKENLAETEALIHIDFSENYNLKHAEEVQSMHFGASRKQLSLHTGVYYRQVDGKLSPSSFATTSMNCDHSAAAIMAHMTPIFLQLREEMEVKELHFLSDGPTSQYRNRFNLNYMGQELKGTFFPKLLRWTWNFSIAGHRKGAADGVGGVLKRTADVAVRCGEDVSDEEKFLSTVAHLNVKVHSIPLENIEKRKKEVATKGVIWPKFQDIMSKHQVIWKAGKFLTKELSAYPLTLLVDNVYSTPIKYSVGDYVIVSYNKKKYTGKITNGNEEGVYKVSCMQHAAKTNVWRFPHPADVCSYEREDIVEKIAEPKQQNRGWFKVPEIDSP